MSGRGMDHGTVQKKDTENMKTGETAKRKSERQSEEEQEIG